MILSLNIANNILNRAFRENIKVTPMKLQKLIYFVYRDYLQRTEEPLFAERFEVWRYGPVLSSVYNVFKCYKSGKIKDYFTENDNTAYIASESNNCLRISLDKVWDEYKTFDGIALSELTHKKNTAWYNALIKNKIYLDDADIMSEDVGYEL